MPIKNLFLLAFRDFFSRKGRLFLSILGIVCGVASLVFLLSLIESVRQTVKTELIGKIPITEMIVRPKEEKFAFSLVADYAGFNEDLIKYIESLPGVANVYPVQALDILTEIEGQFRLLKIPVTKSFLTDVAVFGLPKEVVDDGQKGMSKYVFQPDAKTVPVVLSKNTLEIYNIGFSKSVGIGRFNEDALLGQEFELRFLKPEYDGYEYDSEYKKKDYGFEPVKCRVVGVSSRAPVMGISVPLEYLQYWREKYYKGETKVLGKKKIYE